MRSEYSVIADKDEGLMLGVGKGTQTRVNKRKRRREKINWVTQRRSWRFVKKRVRSEMCVWNENQTNRESTDR